MVPIFRPMWRPSTEYTESSRSRYISQLGLAVVEGIAKGNRLGGFVRACRPLYVVELG